MTTTLINCLLEKKNQTLAHPSAVKKHANKAPLILHRRRCLLERSANRNAKSAQGALLKKEHNKIVSILLRVTHPSRAAPKFQY